MNLSAANRPIGIFDSGVGGLTVFREIAHILPHENLIYLGDTARLPYGNKSKEAVIRYSLECAVFLLQKQIKLLIVACHTASALSLETLQQQLPIPVIGVIDSGFQLLMSTTKSFRVAVLATQSTVASQVYERKIHQHYPQAEVYSIACPLFVPLVEESMFDHAAADLIADHYLSPLQTVHIDALLLACTHYPLMKRAIQKTLDPSVKILESAQICADTSAQFLFKNHLRNPQTASGWRQFYATDHPDKFSTSAKTFLDCEIDLSLISLEKNKEL